MEFFGFPTLYPYIFAQHLIPCWVGDTYIQSTVYTKVIFLDKTVETILSSREWRENCYNFVGSASFGI